MTYRLAFYILLAFWIWETTALLRQGTGPLWIAAFSLVCGYLSHVVYVRAWKPARETDTAVNLSIQLLLPALASLLIFFAILTLAHEYLAADTRGMLIAAGFYFLSYWLPLLSNAWKAVMSRQ